MTILVGYLAERHTLGRRDEVVEEEAGHEGEEQSHAGGEAEAHVDPAHIAGEHLRVFHDAAQRHHGKQRDGKLGYHKDRRHGAELGVEGHIVEEEIGKGHEVATPREEYTQHGGCEQSPLHGPLDDEETEDEEHEHKGTHVDGAAGTGLLAPVLSYLLVDRVELRVGLLHSGLIGCEGHRGASLDIGDEQRPCLVDAVAPLGDVVAVQSTAGLVGGVLLDQLALSAHALLAILPGVVKVAQIDADAQRGAHEADGGGFGKAVEAVAADGLNEEGYHHEEDDEQIVVGHLHVVGLDLKSGEDGCEQQAAQVATAIGQHHAGNHGRKIGQRHHLPDVARGDDDEEVRRERPDDGSQHSQLLAEVEGAQQDVEAQEVGKDVPHILGKPQMVGVHDLLQTVGTRIRRRSLIGGHAAECGVGPARHFAGAGVIFRLLLTSSATRRRVVAVEDAAVKVGRHEIDKRYQRKQNYCGCIEPVFLQYIHCCWYCLLLAR